MNQGERKMKFEEELRVSTSLGATHGLNRKSASKSSLRPRIVRPPQRDMRPALPRGDNLLEY